MNRRTRTSLLLPPALLFAAALSMGSDGWGPIGIVPCQELNSFMSHPYELGSATITGDTLDVEVSFSGGCEPHFFRLCYGPAFMESNPVQARVRLEHDSQNDACEAYLTETRSFDLSHLRRAYQAAYREASGTVILRLGPGLPSDSPRYQF
eukprot:CAMPEP_0198656514 /NCGR_PEP_ID=MMETSP1467-20131203/9944_1 /TAXON_ID=1462469 /ORGANISM="unid. sp., Strain CCMP2135" /LENGTH=150 /DNA_ID=CAMNT_0044392557 /DNA_START=163 /DNA_END=615 /DNA_ORIENTATION=-